MAPNWRPRGPGPIISDDSHKPCFEFKRQGSCKFGNRCRYSHDVQATRRGHAAQPAHNGPRPSRDGKLLEWKRLLEQGPRSANPVVSAASRFFQLGLELMEGDVGAAQQAIKLLATEPGLGFIKIVSDQHIPAMTSEAMRLDLWQTEVRPLFSLVTHACVVDSAVLEQQVSEVFNFIRGVGGSRMERVFDYVVRLVKSWPTSSLTTLSRMATVELSLAVLSKVVDCNSTAAFGPGFSRLVSQFAEIIKQASTPEEEFSRLQAAKYLDYIQQRREVGDNIPDFQTQSQIPVTRGAFVLRRDLPGLLSADGPRHNNDKEDITQIKIMPTYEEIMSPRGEYLPTSDPSEWHVKGIRGRLDREFRLVREDTIGQLRDSVREMLEIARNPQERESHRSKNSLRTYTYDFPIAIDVEIHRTGGMEMVVRCNQLPAVQKMNDKRRRDWWMQCKRLQSGALVCIFDVTGSMLFFTVSDTTMRSKDDREARRPQAREDEQTDENDKKPPLLTLSDDPDSLFVRLQLVDPGNYETKQALQWYRNVDKPLRRYLVEFPGVLLASFKHTLAALQQMHDRPNIPFQSLLTPPDSSKPEDGIKAPQYARKAGFVFDLKSVTHSNVPYTINPQRPPDPDQLSTLSTLDPTQSAALLNTLSRQLSLIQGPPGTGKSYTGEKIVKVLLANKKKASLGPILCVCYTNHALDQLLEHLLDDGTEQIIRIGSRSKSERLQNLNLRNVVRGFIRTKAEGSGLYAAEHMIKDHVNRGKELLKQLSSCDSWSSVKTFLATEYPRHHAELFGYTEDGWKTVHHQPERVIEKWIHNGPQHPNPNRSPDILRAAPLKTMTFNERRRLHRYWLRGIRDPIISKLVKVHEEYNEEIKHRDRIRGDVDLRCLQQVDVVGVTTTGLARSLEVLRKLRCKVMLCEEAGEVLEAHILTALLPSVEHGILIGDHLQLRPQIQNYDLQSTNPRGQQYSLDMSLFERLVQPPHETDLRVPYSVLETQRRMHPSIAELVRSTLYPSLKDAETVKNYPEVVGMKERLFWFHHEQLESKAESNDALSTSHSNNFEVEMTAALVSHLSRQGTYAQGDIAVLTPYLGQLHCLRRRMESMFEICVNERDLEELEALQADGTEVPSPRTSLVSKTTLLKSVRVATVDNFQGEEAKVIVISLVRSNPQSNCGFLRTSNRINVLLSRAQHGMYIIGNSDTYREVSMWADVIKMLARKNKFGSSLELQCPRHPDTPILVSQPDHFVQFSPESGCNLPCDKRLICGHACTGRCHADNLHLAVTCLEDCPRLKKGCDHACPLRCGVPCEEKCQAMLRNINLMLPCGHHLPSAHCWQVQDPASVRCMTMVSRTVPGCKHSVTVRCHEDITSAYYRCTAMCGHNRSCGHKCTSSCYQCNTREGSETTKQNHGICQQQCGRDYSTCSHGCIQTCHDGSPCKPCNQRCEVRCSHSRCNKACHEPCVPCAESTCESNCPHAQCTAPCAAPCNWVPCSLRCEMMLSCGHQCPSICGETCPESSHCQQCASQEIKTVTVDFLEMKEYHEVDLDEEPCIFPDCGHFLTVSSMDGQMGMAAHYQLDENGLPEATLGESEPFSMDGKAAKVCATCRGPLRNISRYGRIVRRAMLDAATKKFASWSNDGYLALADHLITEIEKLSNTPRSTIVAQSAKKDGSLALPGSRSKQINALKAFVGTERYKSISKFRNQLDTYSRNVRKEEQPFQKVAELVRYANIQRGTSKTVQYDSSIVQVKGSLLASVLLLKCDIAIISDFLGSTILDESFSTRAVVQSDVGLDLSVYLQDCKDLIKLAHGTKHPREETQGHVFYAKLCAFSRSSGPSPSQEASPTSTTHSSPPSTTAKAQTMDELREEGLSHTKKAKELLSKYPSAAVFKNEIDVIENTLNDGVYREVTAEEMREVYMASTGELRGTGHWYTCANGHPFTINRCGMPMELATCPECGAPIGGREHIAVGGVSLAEDIEEISRELDQLEVR